MSSEESEEELVQQNESSGSEEEDEPQKISKKVFKIHPLSWRSDGFTNLLESLDRKHMRKISEKARSMIKERKDGEYLVCAAPTDIPEWMVKS